MEKTLIEFFSGSGVLSDYFKSQGWKTLKIDNNKKLTADLYLNILKFKKDLLPQDFKEPEVCWFSPPCTTFSVMTLSKHFKNGHIYSSRGFIGAALAAKCLEIINELRPRYWFIENPRGMLRKQYFMKDLDRKTVTYCQYGATYQKPTDIWTNCNYFIPKKCKPRALCHEQVKRGGRGGVQDLNGAYERGKLPLKLCEEIFKAVNEKTAEKQTTIK